MAARPHPTLLGWFLIIVEPFLNAYKIIFDKYVAPESESSPLYSQTLLSNITYLITYTSYVFLSVP